MSDNFVLLALEKCQTYRSVRKTWR